jgi:hypothetical protein
MSYQYFTPGTTPGNKKNLKRLIDYNSKAINNLESQIVSNDPGYLCNCFKDKVNKTFHAYNDSSQTTSGRISQLTINALGGKTIFGNYNIPAKITYLGGIEGQPGGIPRPPRNRF